MAQTSGKEMDSIVKDMTLKNLRFEKECDFLKKQREVIDRILNLCPSGQNHLEKLHKRTMKELMTTTNNLKTRYSKSEEFIDDAMTRVTSIFGKIKVLKQEAAKETTSQMNTEQLEKILGIPFAQMNKKLRRIQKQLSEYLDKIQDENSQLEVKAVEIRNQMEMVSKDLFRMEKSTAELNEVVLSKAKIVEKLMAEKSEKVGKQLKKLEADVQETNGLLGEALEKVKELEASEKDKEAPSSQRFEEKEKEVEQLKTTLEKMRKAKKEDKNLADLFSNNEQTKSLLRQLSEIRHELAKAPTKKYRRSRRQTEPIDSIENLQQRLEELRKTRKQMDCENGKLQEKKMKMLKIQHEIMLKNRDYEFKREQLHAKELRVAAMRKSLANEKITRNKEYTLRQLELVANDFGFPKTLHSSLKRNNTDDFRTPMKAAKFRNVQKQARKHASIETDFTLVGNDSSVTGIVPFSTTIRKQIEESVLPPGVGTEGNMGNSSFESSLGFSADSGTTHNGSIMGGMFSPLSKNRELLDSGDQEMENTEFSMMEHFQRFNEKSVLRNSETRSDVHLTPSPNDSVSKRFAADIFLTGSSPSDMSRNTSENSMVMSSINGEGEDDGLEVEDVDDEDDSLIANESDLDLDQSVWGSDM